MTNKRESFKMEAQRDVDGGGGVKQRRENSTCQQQAANYLSVTDKNHRFMME